jgi:hypothetical protein
LTSNEGEIALNVGDLVFVGLSVDTRVDGDLYDLRQLVGVFVAAAFDQGRDNLLGVVFFKERSVIAHYGKSHRITDPDGN